MIATRSDFNDSLYRFGKQKYRKDFTDNTFLKKSCYRSAQLFANLPVELRNDKSFATDVILSQKEAFEYAGDDIKNDKSIAMAVLHRYPHNLCYLNSALKEDSEVVLTAVRRSGTALQYAGESPRNNYDVVVMAAITNNERGICYVSDKFKQDDQFMLAAVRKNPWVLRKITPKRRNFAISLAALKENSKIKKYIKIQTIYDHEFLELAKDYLPKDNE